MEVSGKGFDVQPQAQTDMNSLWDSLQDWRTANASVRKIQPGLRDDIFFLQNPDRDQNRGATTRTDAGTRAVRRHADGTSSSFSLRRVIMNRLRRRHP
jgi:hypothetical protein